MLGLGIRVQNTHAANQHRHLRRRQRHQLCLVEEKLLGRDSKIRLQIVAEAISQRLENSE